MNNTAHSAHSANTMNALTYALARQVPDMEHGFTIQTHYGEFVIPAGALASRMAKQVATMFTRELALEQARQEKGGQP